MITFEITCPHCNNKLNIAEEFIGEEVTCRYCLKKLKPTRSSDVNASARSIKEPQSMQNKENKMETFEVTCPHCEMVSVCPLELEGTAQYCSRCKQQFVVNRQFKQPVLCTILTVLSVLSYIAAACSLFPLLFAMASGRGNSGVVFTSLIIGVFGLFQALLYQGLGGYLSHLLKYQWETANNTKDIVRQLKK